MKDTPAEEAVITLYILFGDGLSTRNKWIWFDYQN
jgi:hypothetical protein